MTLTGITKKGRERVKRDGAEGWIIVRTADTVLFSSERGPWLFVSKGGPDHRSSRWIHKFRDPDFKIER